MAPKALGYYRKAQLEARKRLGAVERKTAIGLQQAVHAYTEKVLQAIGPSSRLTLQQKQALAQILAQARDDFTATTVAKDTAT